MLLSHFASFKLWFGDDSPEDGKQNDETRWDNLFDDMMS